MGEGEIDGEGANGNIWEGTPTEHERAVRDQVGVSEAFEFLDAVSAVLAMAIDRAAQSQAEVSKSAVRRTAILLAAIRAFRGVRAASAVIASGYAMEAEPFTRMLLELFVSARAVVDDETGAEAKAWLLGDRARGIGKRVRDAMPDGAVYGELSRATHGDPRAVARALLKTAEGEQMIEWGPAVTPQTEEQLHNLALAARDFAVLLEQVGFERHAELETVDRALMRLKAGWRQDGAY